jgi:hypothetical protein
LGSKSRSQKISSLSEVEEEDEENCSFLYNIFEDASMNLSKRRESEISNDFNCSEQHKKKDRSKSAFTVLGRENMKAISENDEVVLENQILSKNSGALKKSVYTPSSKLVRPLTSVDKSTPVSAISTKPEKISFSGVSRPSSSFSYSQQNSNKKQPYLTTLATPTFTYKTQKNSFASNFDNLIKKRKFRSIASEEGKKWPLIRYLGILSLIFFFTTVFVNTYIFYFY